METQNLINQDIRFREVQLFIELLKIKSIRELARQTHLSPGQVSKIIQSLEAKLETKLLERSTSGVKPSTEALRLLPLLEKVYQSHLQLQSLHSQKQSSLLTFAASSLLSSYLLPQVIADFCSESIETRFRLLDLPPTQLVSVALRGGFQICVHLTDLDWPKTWTSKLVGQMKWGLFCRKDHPLAVAPQLKTILKYPFSYPAYWTGEGTVSGKDLFPIPIKKRILGHETATVTTTIELLKRTDNIAFLPTIILKNSQNLDSLREIKPSGWKKISRPLYLTVKNDYIKNKTFKSISEIIEKQIT